MFIPAVSTSHTEITMLGDITEYSLQRLGLTWPSLSSLKGAGRRVWVKEMVDQKLCSSLLKSLTYAKGTGLSHEDAGQ